ncbi:heavy metal translocating P-type ATPase [uncultured Tyzzerella sp.]|uniref:heavy metal translocating P-type ATPase n=1 Tax=uncultured Tyzzerella sp. TaxID=2321398 RepID=UPI002943857F|nr:heavy metal translocating P-type ATPase [uncultured Tyzzerella sp.]
MTSQIFNILNLDCAHCASLIEEELNKTNTVEEANLNFINKTLKINFKEYVDINSEIPNIQKLIDKIEPGIKIEPINNKSSIKLKLNGLDCAHCASLIEDEVNNLNFVSSASLNFIDKIIKIDFYDNENIENKIQSIKNLIDKIESGLEISVISKDIKSKKDNEDNENNINEKIELSRILIGAGIFVIAKVFDLTLLYTIAYLILGYDVIFKALKNILKGKIFDENFLMALATVGAIIIKEYPEAVAVMLFYQIGEYFQEKAVGKSRKAIKSLVNIKAEYATKENGEKVDPEEISINDIIIIKPGEKVPLDGIIVDGSSFLDMSALIGEAIPRKVSVGDEILSGSINNNSILKIKVTKEYKNSTVSKILDLVENSYVKKSKTESFISKFAKIYTPVIVISAIFLAIIPPLFTGYNFSHWIEKSLVFLVSSCPCALVVSVPLSFFSGIGAASKKGILIKGSVYMQDLSLVDTIVFDKTGTLTKGVFEISKIETNNIDKEEFLSLVYSLESLSIHPVAKSIVNYYENNFKNISNNYKVENFEEISGYGLKGMVNNNEILLGNSKLLDKYNISYKKSNDNGTIVYVAKNGIYIGYIVVSDVIKSESKETITALKQLGISSTIMLSGDRKETAQFVANSIGIDDVYYELLPQDKVSIFEKIKLENNNKKVAFVGDGINDAPVLAISDVGIAMGGVGSDAAIEAADIVIMNDNLEKIKEGIIISKNTIKIVKSNIIFSLLVKFSVLFLALFGYATMWIAVFADVGVSVIAILNAMRKKI